MPITDPNSESLKYWGNDAPICPWCDAEIDISKNDLWELYSEDGHEIECPYCGRDVYVVSKITWTFSTDEQEL